MDGDGDAANAEEAPSPSRRVAKRPRCVDNDVDGGGGRPSEIRLELPPEVWAGVMKYLHYGDVLTCGAVSRSMLHDAMPLLTTLRIDKTSHLNLAVAYRFPDVTDITINALYEQTIEDEGTPDETRDINRVHFGGTGESGDVIEGFAPAAGNFWEGEDSYPDEGHREAMLAFLDSVTTGFRCRALPQHLEISGLCCPNSANQNGHHCETCIDACNKFPLEAVVRFECQRSSIDSALSGRPCGLDVCIERARVESIIESRPGGHDMLRSEGRLLYLLGRGRLYDVVSDDARTVHIVKYKQEQLDEIKRVIQYAELDVKKLSMVKMTDAVMRSFAKNEGDPVPAKGNRYFSEASLDYLKKIGLNLDRDEIYGDAGELVDHAHQIAWVLSETHSRKNADGGNSNNADEYEYIVVDCLKLVRCFSELGEASIHQVTVAIPSLVGHLCGTTNECKEEAVTALSNILKDGTADHREAVLEAKPFPDFNRLLASPNAAIVKATVLALDNIVAHEGTDKVLTALGIQHHATFFTRLVDLLDSEDNECVQSALGVLAAAEEDVMKSTVVAGLFAHVSRLLKATDADAIVLVNCSIMLREILEHSSTRQQYIQRVLDEKLVPRLVELEKTTRLPVVQANLSHVMLNLAGATEKKAVKSLVGEAGFLPALVGLIDSSVGELSLKALSTLLGRLARSGNFLPGGEIIPPLMRLLKRTRKPIQLRAASKLFAECSNHFDVVLTKAELKVVAKLLANDDTQTALNCSRALHNILKGLDGEEMIAVVSIGFVRRLVELLGNGSAELEKSVLKSVYSMSGNKKCIQSISDSDVMKCIKGALMFSSDDETRELACSIVANVVEDAHHIQATIDANVLPSVLQGLPSKRNEYQGLAPTVGMKTLALKIVCKVTETGTASQVKYLVDSGCVKKLCVCLDGDHDNAIVALKTLKNLLAVGKVTGTHLDVQSMGRKLDEWEDEILRLQREMECLTTLREKKVLLEFAVQETHTLSLNGEFGRLKHALKKQLGDQPWLSCNSQLESMASSRGMTPTPMSCLAKSLHRTRERHRQAEKKLDVFREEKEKFRPNHLLQPRWLSDLAEDDRPNELARVNEALKRSISSVLLLKASRASYPRSLQIDEIELGLEEAFMSMGDDETRKTGGGCSKENLVGDSVAERLKRRKLQSITMSKKKARRRGPSKKGAKKE
ncbi:hypothetical protein ACHAXT_011917 [Thalassiosira profunda]